MPQQFSRDEYADALMQVMTSLIKDPANKKLCDVLNELKQLVVKENVVLTEQEFKDLFEIKSKRVTDDTTGITTFECIAVLKDKAMVSMDSTMLATAEPYVLEEMEKQSKAALIKAYNKRKNDIYFSWL